MAQTAYSQQKNKQKPSDERDKRLMGVKSSAIFRQHHNKQINSLLVLVRGGVAA
jgi:hypothetical protein